MEGEDFPLGHEVVHDAEEALLHLPGVLRAEDDHLPPSQVDVHARRRRHVVRVPVAGELTRVVDREVRRAELLQLLLRRTYTPATSPIRQVIVLYTVERRF